MKPATLREFAEKAGATFHRCGKEWGGTWGYSSEDAANCRFNGFATRAEAVEAWGKSTYGSRAWGALVDLLRTASTSTDAL